MIRRAVLTALALIALAPQPAMAALSVDVSSDVIEVSTGFNGATLTVFGAQEQPGALVLVVRGPQETFTVHQKNAILGIWTNTRSQTFTNIPAYYAVASSVPLDQVTSAEIRYTNQIGVRNVLPPSAFSGGGGDSDFPAALLRIQQGRKLYGDDDKPVTYVSPMLYKTKFTLPPAVPPGSYLVSALLFRDGVLIEKASAPFEVVPRGVSADLRRFATDQSLMYGAFSVLIALFAGWLANVLLKRE